MDQMTFGGRYQAEHFIGVPGRLEAYSGTDTTSQAKVAIIAAKPRTDADVSDWTLRAQTAASFQHPDAARLLDWGREGDHFFVTQEWIAGADVGGIVAKQGAIASDKVAKYGSQIAAALSAAHAHGVVHGDIRPEDVVLRAEDDVVLAGLGAPGTITPWAPGVDATPATAYFLSPEQCAGEAATPASDIYSLGAVLYYFAAGKVPFDGPDAATVCTEQQNSPVDSPRRINPYVPAPLEAVILRALAKNPSSRYGSAEEMRQALEAVATGGAAQTQVMPVVAEEAKTRKVWPWVLAAILAVLLLGGAVFAAWWFGYIGGVVVPDLTGQTPAQATKTLQGAQLGLGTVEAAPNYPAGIKIGTIFQQSPAGGGRARKGTTVAITLAGGEAVKVPDVVGQTEAQATSALQAAGFQVAPPQRRYDATADAGTVVQQAPPANSDQLKGSTITIVISRGPQTATVPTVLNQTESAATTAIQKAGFKVSELSASSSSVPKGQVMLQSPSGGVKAEVGTTVTITISSGTPAPKTVTVPSVVGQSQNNALNSLQGAGLLVQIQSVASSETAGTVISTNPAGGTTVNVGSTVTMEVAQ